MNQNFNPQFNNRNKFNNHNANQANANSNSKKRKRNRRNRFRNGFQQKQNSQQQPNQQKQSDQQIQFNQQSQQPNQKQPIQQQQNQNFFRDDFDSEIYGFNDFRSKKNGEVTLNQLMKSIRERESIGLDFLDKLVIEKLKNDEESDVIKIVIKKLLDLLNNYQLSLLSPEEKLSIINSGRSIPD